MLWTIKKISIADISRILAALCSAFLFVSAFPPYNHSESGWAALIPLIILAKYTDYRRSFRYGFLSGLLFWTISISWLLSLSKTGGPMFLVLPGWFILSAYCALYIGLFTMITAWGFEKIKHLSPYIQGIIIPFFIPVTWIGLEYMRSSLFSGFAWNQLGVTQYNNLPVIQLAQWGGVYAVSGLVAIVNTSFAFLLMRFANIISRQKQPKISIEVFTGLIIWLLCLSFGIHAIRQIDAERIEQQQITVTAIQPNIKQLKKWPEDFAEEIYKRIYSQTSLAILQHPNLIVWPETALPGTIGIAHYTERFTANLAKAGVPILAGIMEERELNNEIILYNSSFLFDTTGNIIGSYRKCHLVPFGEYIPLENKIKILKKFAPLGFSCLPGKESTVFTLPGTTPAVKFSALICFEDTISPLARRSVRNGARLLINQTNDAWFDGTAGAMQHMTHSIFRCIENRVPAVRAANTGITAFIDSTGRFSILKNNTQVAFAQKSDRIYIPPENMHLTIYTRFGDYILAIPCAVIIVIILAIIMSTAHKKSALSINMKK